MYLFLSLFAAITVFFIAAEFTNEDYTDTHHHSH